MEIGNLKTPVANIPNATNAYNANPNANNKNNNNKQNLQQNSGDQSIFLFYHLLTLNVFQT